jgi:hypothetical protein
MPKKSVFVVLLMAALALSACNFPIAFEDPAEVENAVAETVAAYEAEEELVIPTLPLSPTSTPMPTVTPEPVVEETEVPEATKVPCNSAYFVNETVPDNTKFGPGATFNKGWTLRNVGYCTWSSGYKLAFESGDKMNGPDAKEIGVEVAPNGEVEIVLSLTAPSTAGTYRGYWMLQTADGADIGPMWVQIIVE